MATARGFATATVMWIARVAALGWVAPALYWNLDWSPGSSLTANIMAAIMILAGAGIIEGIRHSRSWALSFVGLLTLILLLYSNANTAFKNLAAVGEASSDARRAKMDGGSHLESQVSQLSRQREAQVQLAGEKPVAALEAETRGIQLSDLRRWSATSQCQDVTASQSGDFCRRVTEANAKVAAAKKRDDLDEQIKTLNGKVEAMGYVPVTADAYAENVAAFLGAVTGRKFDAAAKRALTAHYEIVRSIALELMAAVMPAFHLMLIDVLVLSMSGLSGATARFRAAVRREAPCPSDGRIRRHDKSDSEQSG